jgi:epoxide hydrolase 4
VSALVVLNCPHPRALRANGSFRQFLRSWYFYFFQLPWLPEVKNKKSKTKKRK